jgi:hypothetical protein
MSLDEAPVHGVDTSLSAPFTARGRLEIDRAQAPRIKALLRLF